MDLIFDTTYNGDDVRDYTNVVASFMQPPGSSTQNVDTSAPATNPGSPPKSQPVVAFEWGVYLFKGVMESFRETIDFFSAEGVPLRSVVSIGLARQDEVLTKDPSGVSAPVQGSLIPTPSGGSVQKMSDLGGDSGAARQLASDNNLDSLRFTGGASLQVNAGVQLNAAAGFSVGASAAGGLGLSLGGGAGTGSSVGAGIGISGEPGSPPAHPRASLQASRRVREQGFPPAQVFPPELQQVRFSVRALRWACRLRWAPSTGWKRAVPVPVPPRNWILLVCCAPHPAQTSRLSAAPASAWVVPPITARGQVCRPALGPRSASATGSPLTTTIKQNVVSRKDKHPWQ